MNTYLITGGAGFIGSNFVRFLLEKYTDIHVLCLDKLTYAGNINNIKTELNNSNFTFIKGDINDPKILKDIFSKYKINCIINFAAESHVDRSIDSPQVFLKTNILGTQNLLKAAKEQWEISENEYGDGKKFIQISTDEVYGSCNTGKFKESSPLDPHSPYAASKASADMMVKAYIDTYNFPALITRCSNNYGPYQFPEKLIPLMINNMLNGLRLPVYGKGENIRDWIHVLDHCKAVDLIANKGKIGEIYNIQGNSEKKNIDLVKLLIIKIRQLLEKEPQYKNLMNAPLEKINDELIEFVKDRPGHDFRYAMDSTKIEKLGWSPKVSFDEGIKLTVLWYFENMGWLKNVISGEYQKYYEKMYVDR
tara:strand:+ start:3898 stop:4989 length:1092 start_codon:yes stop_codon:yes gene_type:complete